MASGIVPKPEYVPAFASLAERDHRAGVEQVSGGRQPVAQHDRRRRQEGRNRFRSGEGRDPLGVELLEVVDRRGTEPDPELRGPGSRELFGVEPEPSPAAIAARPIRSVASRSKKPASAKTSTKSARPSAATAGIISSATSSACSIAVVPSGTAWAPRNVGTTRTGRRSATRRMTRRCRSSSSSETP